MAAALVYWTQILKCIIFTNTRRNTDKTIVISYFCLWAVAPVYWTQILPCTLGCIEFFLYLIFIRLTLFSLYFLILRTIYFLAFFYLRPPSFANFNFCLLMGIRRNSNGKIIRFWIPCRNMVWIWSIWFKLI